MFMLLCQDLKTFKSRTSDILTKGLDGSSAGSSKTMKTKTDFRFLFNGFRNTKSNDDFVIVRNRIQKLIFDP